MDPNKKQNIPLVRTSDIAQVDIDHVPLSIIGQMSGYWRGVVMRRKLQHEVSLRRIILGQLITIFVVGLVTVAIEDSQEALLMAGATLLLYPALTDMLMSSGSVLSASIHHDLENQEETTFRFSLIAIIRSIAGTIISGTIVGLVAATIAFFVLDIAFIATLQLAVVAAALAAGIGLPSVLIITLLVRNYKSNPDEIIPPFESSAFNIIMLLSIVSASRILA